MYFIKNGKALFNKSDVCDENQNEEIDLEKINVITEDPEITVTDEGIIIGKKLNGIVNKYIINQ